MSTEYQLKFKLESEACFSRGDGLPGIVDIEVNHDDFGLPFIGGRTLKGLLHAEAALLVETLRQIHGVDEVAWARVSNNLFGAPGAAQDLTGCLHFGDGLLPESIRSNVAVALQSQGNQPSNLSASHVLDTLTTIRRQTAINDVTGAPEPETLRAMRVVLRGTIFSATLIHNDSPDKDVLTRERAFLAACVCGWRRAGRNKTRGYGRITATLHEPDGADRTKTWLKEFTEAIAS